MKELALFIASYNEGNLLSRCIDSILAQKESSKIDIIIIFDCGDELTKSIGENLAKENANIEFLANNVNKGLAFNRSLSKQYFKKYKYISYVDADDILSSNALEIYFKLIKTYPEIDIFFNDLHKMNHVVPFVSIYNEEKFIKTRASSLLYTYYNAMHLHVYKVSAIRDFNFDENVAYDDLDYKLNFINSNLKVLITQCKVIGYYINENGMTLGKVDIETAKKRKRTIEKYERILSDEEMTFLESKHPASGMYTRKYEKNYNMWYITKKAMQNPDTFYQTMTSYLVVKKEIEMLIEYKTKEYNEQIKELKSAQTLDKEIIKKLNNDSAKKDDILNFYRKNIFIKILRKIKVIKIY